MKKLYRSRNDKILAGVLGGAAKRYDIDPSILRLGFVFVGFVTGCLPAIITYLAGAVMIPKSPVED